MGSVFRQPKLQRPPALVIDVIIAFQIPRLRVKTLNGGGRPLLTSFAAQLVDWCAGLKFLTNIFDRAVANPIVNFPPN